MHGSDLKKSKVAKLQFFLIGFVEGDFFTDWDPMGLKSPFFITIWENIFGTVSKHLMQIQAYKTVLGY